MKACIAFLKIYNSFEWSYSIKFYDKNLDKFKYDKK